MKESWSYKICPNEIINAEIGEIYINDDGILVIRYKNNLDFDIEKAKSAIQICENISNGKKMSVLIFTGEFGDMPDDTRKYLSGKSLANHRLAVALVIKSLAHRIMAFFIISIRKKYYPSMIFSNERDALTWLKKFS